MLDRYHMRGRVFYNLYGLPSLGQNLTGYYGLINDKKRQESMGSSNTASPVTVPFAQKHLDQFCSCT